MCSELKENNSGDRSLDFELRIFMKNYISILYPCQYLKWFWGKNLSHPRQSRLRFQSLHYRRATQLTSDEAEHCLSAASCAGALGNKSRRMKIMQGELSFCFVFLCSSKKNDVAVGESFNYAK